MWSHSVALFLCGLVLAVRGIDLDSEGCVSGTSCEYIKTHTLHRVLDVSHLPELSENRLRVCVYDRRFSEYHASGGPGGDEWRSVILDRSLNARWAEKLARVMFGEDQTPVVADIVVVDDWLAESHLPPHLPSSENKRHACLDAVRSGRCDLGICDIPAESSWLSVHLDASHLKTIEASEPFLKSVVVYPKTSACGTSSAAHLCGHCVHVLQNSTEHLMLLGLNAVGGACHDHPVSIEAWCDNVHGHFMDNCRHANSESPCFLLWEANDYWYDVCRWESASQWYDNSSEDDAVYQCDKARLTTSAGGHVWVIRKPLENQGDHFEEAIIRARDGLWRSGHFSSVANDFENSQAESLVAAFSGRCCPSDSEQIQECAFKSNTCVVPAGESRCVWG